MVTKYACVKICTFVYHVEKLFFVLLCRFSVNCNGQYNSILKITSKFISLNDMKVNKINNFAKMLVNIANNSKLNVKLFSTQKQK